MLQEEEKVRTILLACHKSKDSRFLKVVEIGLNRSPLLNLADHIPNYQKDPLDTNRKLSYQYSPTLLL